MQRSCSASVPWTIAIAHCKRKPSRNRSRYRCQGQCQGHLGLRAPRAHRRGLASIGIVICRLVEPVGRSRCTCPQAAERPQASCRTTQRADPLCQGQCQGPLGGWSLLLSRVSLSFVKGLRWDYGIAGGVDGKCAPRSCRARSKNQSINHPSYLATSPRLGSAECSERLTISRT